MASSKLILIALLSLAAANAQRLRGSESTTDQTVRGMKGEEDSTETTRLKSHRRVRARPNKKNKLTNKKNKKARKQAKAIDSSIADSVSETQAEHAEEDEGDLHVVGGRHADKMAPRIINGDEAPRGKYTFAVSLQDRGHFCGGSLIARDYVLTAAHCKGGRFDVVAGRHDLGERGGQVLGVSREIVHPGYNAWTSEFCLGVIVAFST